MKVPSRNARVRARVARARVVVRAGVPLDLKTRIACQDLKTQIACQDLSLDLNLVQDLDLDLSLETKTQIALALPQATTTTRE